MNVVLPPLANNLASSNPSVRATSEDVLNFLTKTVNGEGLFGVVQCLSNVAMFGNNRVKPMVLKKLAGVYVCGCMCMCLCMCVCLCV